MIKTVFVPLQRQTKINANNTRLVRVAEFCLIICVFYTDFASTSCAADSMPARILSRADHWLAQRRSLPLTRTKASHLFSIRVS